MQICNQPNMSETHGQDDLLKFRMGQNGELSTECGMVVSARWYGVGFFRIYWEFSAQKSLGFTEKLSE